MTDVSAGLGWVEKLMAFWMFLCIVIGLAWGRNSGNSARTLALACR